MSKKTNNGKRFAAIACAAVVGVSGLGIGSTSVQAAETTVSEAGAMNYVDMSQYTQVLLPTSSTLAFALDPQGLSTMTEAAVDTKNLVAAAGNIVSNGEVSVANYGYYPLKLRANFYVTDTGASTFVESEAEVETDTSKRIYLTVTPSSAKTTVTEDGTGVTGTTGYAAAGDSLSITGKEAAKAQGMVYALAGAEYEFTKTANAETGKDDYAAQRKSGGDYGAATFKIGGKINKNADWVAYTGAKPKTLKLNAVFSYSTMTTDEYAYLTDATDGFIKSGTYNQVADTAPEISATGLRMDLSKGGTLPLSLGTGATATTVKGVNIIRHSKKIKLSDNSETKLDDVKTAVKNFTMNATGTAVNISAIDDMKTRLAKVDTTDTTCYDEANKEYLKVYYSTDASYGYEYNYVLVVTLADGTVSEEIPITFIELTSPTVEYTGAALPKLTTAANPAAAIATFAVNLGNCGATEITKVELNTSKTTATVSAVDNTKILVNNGKDISIGKTTFKYVSSNDVTNIVFTATFDSGETVDVAVPVAAK